MVRILIVAEHKIFSEALSKLLSSDPLFEVTAICNDNETAVTASWNQQPDIVLLDVNRDRRSAINAAKRIASCTKAKIIALSMHLDLGYGNHMLGAGAAGYITKMAPAAEMLLAVREVAKGNVYICNESKGLLNTQPSAYSLPQKQAADKAVQPAKIPASNHWHTILRFPN